MNNWVTDIIIAGGPMGQNEHLLTQLNRNTAGLRQIQAAPKGTSGKLVPPVFQLPCSTPFP